MRICVVGGGASGLMAAIAAAETPGVCVTLYERQPRVGKKLLASGNGRCNLTNKNASPRHYHGSHPDFAAPALGFFPVTDTLAFFDSLGLLTVCEPDGRVYPLTDRAASVLDVLRFRACELGVIMESGTEISAVTPKDGGFRVTTPEGNDCYQRVILACGGEASPGLGGTPQGYRLLRELGHRVTELKPALVQLKSEDKLLKSLKGIRADAAVTLFCGERQTAASGGEVQFAENGLSGPAIFEISRAASLGEGNRTVVLDLMRGLSKEGLTEKLRLRRKTLPSLPAENLLTGFLQSRVGLAVIRRAGICPDRPVGAFADAQLDTVAEVMKHLDFRLSGTMGLQNAQVTVGGADTRAFSPDTMESRLHPGLYACGELLDIDGDCGGFNLQWAWSSGRLAGVNAARKC